MRIADQHIEGTPKNRLSKLLGGTAEYTPVCAWPDDCMVQWGNGIIPATPFFEAFPKGTFIRGEGATILEAERQAFEKYQKDINCDHVWGRQRPGGVLYTNGAGWCRKCGAFRSKMFPVIEKLGWWRKPLTMMEHDHMVSMDTDQELNEHMDRKYPEDREDRKKRHRILKLRFRLFGVDTSTSRYF